MASTTTGVQNAAVEAEQETCHGLPRRLWNRAKGSHIKHERRNAERTSGAAHSLPKSRNGEDKSEQRSKVLGNEKGSPQADRSGTGLKCSW